MFMIEVHILLNIFLSFICSEIVFFEIRGFERHLELS